jgi:V/A-type H+-transporting ATPase subunit A
MPVAAREASIYLGVTIAEYFRDMGYRVAVMVDSISRWAEALREISARLQEMPGEEGFPPYLASRLGHFFERAGRAQTNGTPAREGAVTIIAAISPPGGDFSEPVTQAALRVTGAVWALDPSLAHQRHFPAVDWGTSYSLYAETCGRWFAENVAPGWPALRRDLLSLLQRESELRDIASIVGPDSLDDKDRLMMEVARIAREIVLRQNAFHPHDGACPPHKTYALAAAVRAVHEAGLAAIARGDTMDRIDLEPFRRALSALRDGPAEDTARLAESVNAAITVVAGAPAAEAPA